MTDAKTICRSCGKTINHVIIDRKPEFKGSQYDMCFFGVSLNGTNVSLPIPNSAMCRNCGDEDFIAECIHCPECDHYPFYDDIQVFDNGCDMTITASTIPLDDKDAIEDARTKHCAQCGEEIPWGTEYFQSVDNFLIRNYFDSNEDNIFCSERCFLDALMVKSFVNGEDRGSLTIL